MSATVRWHQSLAWKFFLRTALAILFIMGVVLGVAYQQAQEGARNAAERGIRGAARVLDKHVIQEARVLDAGLEVFVTQSSNSTYIDVAEQRSDPGSVRNYLLQSLDNLKSEIAVVVRPSGNLLSCTTDGHKQDYSDVSVAQMALDPEGAKAAGFPGPSYAGFMEIADGAFKGHYQVVARTLRTPDGHLIGAMVVGNKLGDRAAEDLRELSVGKAVPPSHLVFLAEGQVVGATLPASDRAAFQARLAEAGMKVAMKSQLSQGKASDLFPITLGGTKYLARVNPLRGIDGPRHDMATAVLLPLEPFLAPFRRIQAYILGTGLAGLAVALWVSLRTARAVTAPLQALTEATSLLAEGERPEIPRLDSQDEVGYLTQAFRALLSELKAKEELLSALDDLRAHQRAQGISGNLQGFPETHAGLTAVDLEATLALPPGASQAMTAVPSAPVRRRLTLREGDIFADRYRIESILGKGGMGIVLKARDQQLDEDVALKVIRPEHDLSEGFLDQLKQEIKLARRITHRYVLRTHDFGESQGIPFVSMEYLKGVTLKQLLDDRGRLPLSLVLRIGRQVAEGLEAAHAEGVVHRDIKPLNILFDTKGDAKLMDFGLAAPVATKGTNEEGQVFGTPRYMAPEQVRGERVDPRTDLYALGVMLFELATGEPPFDAPGVTDLLRLHLNAPVPDPQTRLQSLPPAFGALVQRLMAKRIEDRPAGAGEVVEDLKLIAAGGQG